MRLVAATNRDLTRMVKEQQFRSDLYYRLNVFPLVLPPLRERQDDIPRLVRHFTQRFARRMHRKIDTISQSTMDALVRYAWPGNVRDLQDVIERAVILSKGSALEVSLSDLSGSAASSDESSSALPTTLSDAERAHIIATALRLSRHMVHNYVKAICRDHGVRSRTELMAKAIQTAATHAVILEPLNDKRTSVSSLPMRRFRRILLNALTELSLALAVLVVGLWVRSHWRASRVHGGIGPSRAFVLAAKQGQVLFIPFKALAGGSPWFVRDVPVDSHDASPAGDARAGAGRLGFAVVRDPIYFVMNPVQSTPQGRVIVMGAATTMLRGTGVVVPMWAVFAVLALPVVVRAFAKARSSRRRAANRCPLCDYDLWATPDRCPECGAVPARPPGIQP